MYYFIIGLALFVFTNTVVVFAGAVFVLIDTLIKNIKKAANTAEGETI